MRIKLSCGDVEIPAGTTAAGLRDSHRPGADVIVVNGAPVTHDVILRDGDEVVCVSHEEKPPACELGPAVTARCGPGVASRLGKASVGIAGCGGLGSNVAVALARSGIGRLVLVDPDTVDPTNLNRQHFFVAHIGLPKVEALASVILGIHPPTRVETFAERIRPGGLERLFAYCDVVAECLDTAGDKAFMPAAVRAELPGVPLVTVSGIAGHGDANEIVTREVMAGVHLVGDQRSDVTSGVGIMAPRVLVAAGHQANRIVQIILGEVVPREKT